MGLDTLHRLNGHLWLVPSRSYSPDIKHFDKVLWGMAIIHTEMRINELQLQVKTGVNPTNVMLSRIKQTERSIHYMLPFTRSSNTNTIDL